MPTKRRSIYIPSLDTVYQSIAAASKAVGVDASNIGKVLRGQRAMAGGYVFVEVPADYTPEKLHEVREAVAESLTSQQQRRLERTQEKYIGRLSPEAAKARERAAKQEQAAASKAAKQLHKTLVDVNKILKQYKKMGVEAYSGIIPELEMLKNIIGKNKQGYFNTDIKNLKSKFRADQLAALEARVRAQRDRKGFKNVSGQIKKRSNVAYQLGVLPEDLEKYENVLPDLWNLLELSRKASTGNEGTDPPVYNTIRDAIMADVDPEKLKNAIDDLTDMYNLMADELKKAEDDPAEYDVDAIREYYDNYRDDVLGSLEDEISESESDLLDDDPEWYGGGW